MGKLIKTRKWIEETFEKDSRPSAKQVREWVIDGAVPGRVIGDEVYVDAEAFALELRMDLTVTDQIVCGAQLLH